METEKRARPGFAVFCFAAALAEQLYLLRSPLAAGIDSWPAILYPELVSWVLLAVGIGIIAVRKAWPSSAVCLTAFILFAVHLAVNVMNFSALSTLYFAGVKSQYASYGPALVTLKLVLILLGITAGIPEVVGPRGREYAQKVEAAYRRQEMEWAKANMEGARKDAKKTLDQLRKQLSREDLEELLASLEEENAAQPPEDGKH